MKDAKQRRISTKRNPKRGNWRIIVGAIVAAAVILTAGVFLWMRTNNSTPKTVMTLVASQPAAQTFSDNTVVNFVASDTIPSPNNNRTLNRIQPLVVSYDLKSGNYAPAFRMNATTAEINNAVKIIPQIHGEWKITGANSLVFTPEYDWPADTKFTVKISKKIINRDVRPDSYTVSFKTPDIIAKIDSFDIYPDASAPRKMVGMAIVSFNYPIDPENFADRVSMKLDGEKLKFSVKLDRFHRTAFITSAPVDVRDAPQTMRLKLNAIAAAAGDGETKKLTATTTLAAADNFFKVSSITTTAADDANANARQLVLVNMTAAATGGLKWSDYIDVYLLPRYTGENEDGKFHRWSMDEITDAVLKKSKKLKITPVEFVNPAGVHQYAFEYDVSERTPRYIYVMVKDGIPSRGGFKTKNSSDIVLSVPYPDKTVKIAGSGALLSLAGERRLGIMARGGADAAYVNLYKVKSSEINHLISQTYNVFASNMEFKSWSFGADDMSVVFQKKISFADPSMKKTNYASVDLGDYLDRTGADKTGIFIIQTGPTSNQAQYSDKRLILLTNLGIIRKLNLDGTSVMFISNLGDGTPAADIDVSVLGRNGNAVWTGRTNSDGRVDLPKLARNEYKNAKEPVAIVARRGADVSFIPYSGAYDINVEYSKFDIDGIYSSATAPMNAFVFTDRGVYRPGENAVIAGIVKNKSFKPLAGVPVKLEIQDSRGRTIHEEMFSLESDGMFDARIQIGADAPIGEYYAYLYSLNAKNKPQDTLGQASFRVEEFTPDTLKLTATISGADGEKWISPDNITAHATLRNLFGTAASNHKITARATLRPLDFKFKKYPGYIFSSNFISGAGMAENAMQNARTFTMELPDARTGADGVATMPVKFDQTIPSGTYLLSLNINGFEGGGGRGVQTTITARVSDAGYLVGYHANSALSYVARGAARSIDFIALSQTGEPTAATGLSLRLVKREKLTSLVKDYNDYYKYQTVSRDKIISQTPFDIKPGGATVELDTRDGGTYFLQVLDASEKILASAEYFVAADGNAALQTDTRAEMQITLNAAEYAPGADIAVSISAPYSGTGLITIERDKVYAYKWFRTNAASSVQHIKVPAGFEGTGYVNVSFVRDINSLDVFTTPYAYAVAPFRADIGPRTIDVSLTAPEIARGDRMTVQYKTNKNARLMIFAVDAGILQVAKYKIPNPLGHFFQKSALQVETFQILSLLLPEYKILREFAKTGGGDYENGAMDGGAPLTNPFARKTNMPVAFYSGIINTNAGQIGEISFDIPEYFNGALRIFAVAANDSAMGATNTETLVQRPVIISVAAPLAVAPNDTFDVGASITNMTPDSENARAVIAATTDGRLKIVGDAGTEMEIPENTEKLWTTGVRADDAPGNAEITLQVALKNASGTELAARSATATMSIRPITAFETKIKTGLMTSKSLKIKDFRADLYPAFASRRIFVSNNAAALIKPMFEYLAHYDYPCTEQLVSRMTPYVLAPADEILGTTFDESAKKIADVLAKLKNRQNSDGSFELWASRNTTRNNESNANAAYITAYVAQFMSMARDAGFAVPDVMNSRAVDFLRTYVGTKINDDADARAHAFAIYVITRNGYITTGYIDQFEEYASKNLKNWESGIMGAYIAASYKMLKQNDRAEHLIAKYRPTADNRFEYVSMFDNNVANDAIYAYLRTHYFNAVDPARMTRVMEYINDGDYTSFTSAAVIMGLAGGTGNNDAGVSVLADGAEIPGGLISDAFVADIPDDATTLEIKCEKCNTDKGVFYTVIQQGFPRRAVEASNGIEITREYYDRDGRRITGAEIGDAITVKIFARSLRADNIASVVITDLLPGGFEAEDVSGNMDFHEIREDRVLVYTDLDRRGTTITYTARPTVAGRFHVPPVRAASMYNPQINATGPVNAEFTVSNETAD